MRRAAHRNEGMLFAVLPARLNHSSRRPFNLPFSYRSQRLCWPIEHFTAGAKNAPLIFPQHSLADFIIHSQNFSFYVHQFVLARSSGYFRA